MALTTRNPRPYVLEHPKSPITEAYRTIRTNIQFSRMVSDAKTIMVTSSQPGEGKTSTASNLAVVTAQAGHRVLLVDADLRKPQIHQRFQISNLDGLSNVLIREKSIEECIVSTDIPGLFILPSGQIPPNPSELLGSKAFAQLLDWVRVQFDIIYLDAPPVLAVADALILSHIADGTIMVIDSANTKRRLVQKSLTMLQNVDAKILGTILNRIEPSASDPMYYYYTE